MLCNRILPALAFLLEINCNTSQTPSIVTVFCYTIFGSLLHTYTYAYTTHAKFYTHKFTKMQVMFIVCHDVTKNKIKLIIANA